MRFAISIPQLYDDGEFDPAAFGKYCSRIEELGFDSAWTQEQVLGAAPQLAPLEVMTYAAACTQRIRLGCTVFVSTLHSPVHLAKALASLDQLSGGRIDVGIGTGGKFRPFAAFGMSPDRYVARFTEGLALMKALWTEPAVTFDGEFWQLKDAAMEPKPAQKPHPPVWFGANGEAALRRAARLGDGFFGAGATPTATFADQVPVVRAALAEAGRDPGGFPVAKRLYIVVDDDAVRARERVNAALARQYGRRVGAIEAAAVAGPPGDCAREVAAAAAAGAELILFTSLDDPAEQAERIAAEVIPWLS
jgi:probable F420-dependent oxidoreductase